MNIISNWMRRTFADGQIVLLLLIVILAFMAASFFAKMFAPVIAAIVLAFLLDGPTERLMRKKFRPLIAQTLVFLAFIIISLILLLEVLPPLIRQIIAFVGDAPLMIGQVRDELLALRNQFPDLVSEDELRGWFSTIGTEVGTLGPELLAFSVSGITGTVTLLIYLVLVPLMVFFFLKDKIIILGWLNSFLPQHKPVLDQIWREVTQRAGDYARGKIYQILIITTISFIVYQIIDIRYATLLAVATGLSVVIPYIGAAAVTFPIALVGFLQWGWGSEMLVGVIAYFAIQAFDGNILNPILFSGVMKLHPNAIIVAVLFFGGIWGFWGLFFAIPLATVANAVIRAMRDYSKSSLLDGDEALLPEKPHS